MTELVKLGRTDLLIHPIGLGANKIAAADPETNTEYGGDVLLSAINKGLNFIDTAFMYGMGTSETIIGKTLKEHNLRNNVVIATKGAHEVTEAGMVLNNNPGFLTEQVENSLRRLQTDHIDLYYIHFPDEATPKAEAVGALQRLKEQGKIRAIGVSNFNLEQLKEGNANGCIDVVQDEYNLLNQSAEESLFPYCREQGISFIPYFPFASGLLAGKYTETSVLSEKQQQRPQFQGDTYLDILKRVDLIRPLAVKHHTGLQNIVLAYYLTKDVVDAVIPGARNRQQVLENLEAAEVRLDAADIALIQQAFPASYRLPK